MIVFHLSDFYPPAIFIYPSPPFPFRYALPEHKARAVAQETLAVWCSLASRLGVWAVKAELEDLCFAVLQVRTKGLGF